jgi:hypothetical protein
VCRGLVPGPSWGWVTGPDGEETPRFYCRVCKVEFKRGENASDNLTAYDWFKQEGTQIAHGTEIFEQARVLAKLVKNSRGGDYIKPWPTMRLLFEVLSRAKSFVHFASWGISHQLVGVLKLTSIRVPVYGFVSSADREITRELTGFPKETPNLNAKVISPRDTKFEAPHQKLVIVDGLLGFKGSTNLTSAALRKADTGLDVSEVVTDYQAVIDFNNRFFAPVWKKITVGDITEVLMWDEPSF